MQKTTQMRPAKKAIYIMGLVIIVEGLFLYLATGNFVGPMGIVGVVLIGFALVIIFPATVKTVKSIFWVLFIVAVLFFALVAIAAISNWSACSRTYYTVDQNGNRVTDADGNFLGGINPCGPGRECKAVQTTRPPAMWCLLTGPSGW